MRLHRPAAPARVAAMLVVAALPAGAMGAPVAHAADLVLGVTVGPSIAVRPDRDGVLGGVVLVPQLGVELAGRHIIAFRFRVAEYPGGSASVTNSRGGEAIFGPAVAYTFTERASWPVVPFVTATLGAGIQLGAVLNGDAGGLGVGLQAGGEVGLLRRLSHRWDLVFGLDVAYQHAGNNGPADFVLPGAFIGVRGRPAATAAATPSPPR
jgi:hypothetical protein